jgi:single-strand DNA-binding protein
MAGMAKATIIGNLGGDPEMRYTAQGRPFTTFSVACNRAYTQDGSKREETEWFRVIVGGKLAEVCSQYLSKGRQVYVEGRLSTRTYDATNGEKRFSMQIAASEVQMLGSRGDGAKDEPSGDELDATPF